MRWSREEQQYTDTEEGYTAVQLYGRRPEEGAWEVSRASGGLASDVWRLRARSADRAVSGMSGAIAEKSGQQTRAYSTVAVGGVRMVHGMVLYTALRV